MRGLSGSGEVVSAVEVPHNGDLLESVLDVWLREMAGSLQLVNMTLLWRRVMASPCSPARHVMYNEAL